MNILLTNMVLQERRNQQKNRQKSKFKKLYSFLMEILLTMAYWNVRNVYCTVDTYNITFKNYCLFDTCFKGMNGIIKNDVKIDK